MASNFNKNSLAVIIPMYNEEKVAGLCIDQVIKAIQNIRNISLIVVNDGSIDNTAKIIANKKRKYKTKLITISYKKNKGYGGALQMAIQRASALGFTWCLYMDSDLTNDPSDIAKFAKNRSDNYDCIKASRYIKDAKVINVPAYRKVISLVGNSFASRIFNVGINDCTNGFRMVRLSMISNIIFKENNFSIILEEMYYLKKNHARFTEIPYTLTARTNSRSHFSYKPKIFYDYFKYVFKSYFL